MEQSMERRYLERLNRYTTAMQGGTPDMVPIRPFVAEFTAKYSGMTCQDVTHDYRRAFEAVRRTATDFDWDAVVSNMVYVWTGLTQSIGIGYYGVPGMDTPEDTGFQYREPAEGQAYMGADEYDALIDDPTAFLFNTWLPRVAGDVSPIGGQATYRNNLSFLKGGMAMQSYFNAFGEQNARLRSESGTVSAISGILKAPFDIIADKLRGYLGLMTDMYERPGKVLAACEALMPHLLHVALSSADPNRQVPIGFWMHRGCTPFISPQWFSSHYWSTLKPIIEELWARGHQTLFYAEGDWGRHLEDFRGLPERSIVYHVDRGDIFDAHRRLGDRFCLSGGISNVLLAIGTRDEVIAQAKGIIDGVARNGAYILDASAIIQNDARVENMRALTDFVREYGVYSSGHSSGLPGPAGTGSLAVGDLPGEWQPEWHAISGKGPGEAGAPGVCLPWESRARELPNPLAKPELFRDVWMDIEEMAYGYIWQVLLSF